MNASRKSTPVAEEDLTPDALEQRGGRLIIEGNRLIAKAQVRREMTANDWVGKEQSGLKPRQHNELARSGTVTASKIKGRWYIRREDLAAYFKAHVRVVERADEDVDEIIERVMSDQGEGKRR